MLVCDIHNKSS